MVWWKSLVLAIALTHASAKVEEEKEFCSSERSENCGVDETLNDLQQDDPKLIQAIQQKFLHNPSGKTVPYNFTSKSPDLHGQLGQPLIVEAMLKGKQSLKNGFFVEAGAFDGENLSNSLFFELKYGWRGILAEPNSEAYQKMRLKNRRSWTTPHCFSTKTSPEIVEFDEAGLFGGIINPDVEHKPGDEVQKFVDEHGKLNEVYHNFRRKTVHVQCFPFYSYLLAVGNPTVTYLSLDIEGAELQVLKTIPWDQVDIKILDIETNHIGQIFPGAGKDLVKLLQRAGYKHFRNVGGIDDIFVKKDFDVNEEARHLSL